METRLTTLDCPSIHDAPAYFGSKTSQGETPIVLRPSSVKHFLGRSGMPHGMWAMKTRNQRFVSVVKPGFTILGPLDDIEFLITKQDIPFDIPVKEVPTSDNVKVQIDVLLVFRIIDPEKFIYNCGGPEKLQERLKNVQEEQLRALAHTVKAKEILDLIYHDESQMVKEMSEALVEDGVEVVDVTITDVALPPDMMESLQNATKLVVDRSNLNKAAEYRKLIASDKSKIVRSENQQTRKREEEDSKASLHRTQINQEVSKIVSETASQVQSIKNEMESSVNKTIMEAEKKSTQMITGAQNILKEKVVEAERKAAETRGQALAEREELLANAALAASKQLAKAVSSEANAEKVAAKQLGKRRDYDLELKRAQVLRNLAANPRVTLANQSDNVVAQMIATEKVTSVLADE